MRDRSHKAPKSHKGAMGFRPEPDLEREIRNLAKKTERPYTFVITKALQFGLPEFVKKYGNAQ